MLKFNYKNTRTMSLTRSGVFIVNFEHISPLFLIFLMLTLNKYMLVEILKVKFCDDSLETFMTFF